MSQIIEAAKCREYECRVTPINAHSMATDTAYCSGPKCAHWQPIVAWKVHGRAYLQELPGDPKHPDAHHGRCGLSSRSG